MHSAPSLLLQITLKTRTILELTGLSITQNHTKISPKKELEQFWIPFAHEYLDPLVTNRKLQKNLITPVKMLLQSC